MTVPILKMSRIFAFVLLVSILCGSSSAETISGRVFDASSKAPLEGTLIRALDVKGKVIARAVTGRDGDFALDVATESRFELVFSRLGYETLRVSDVRPEDLSSIDLVIDLNLFFTLTDTLVVSASRAPEPEIEAPAAISVAKRIQIDEQSQMTPVDITRDLTGVDFARTGLIQSTYAARGIRGSMSASMLSMTDNRYSSIPVLNFNIPYMIPYASEDVERIEIVRGPGSAVYGPNTSQGVIHIITRSPFESQGISATLMGGERDIVQGTIRYAESWSDKIGFKITGQYFRGNDWEYYDPKELKNRQDEIDAGADPDTLKIGNRDFGIERVAGEARLDYRVGDDGVLSLRGGSAGALTAIDIQSTVGALQVRDWYNSFTQCLYEQGRLRANFFYNWTDFGETFQLRSGEPLVNKSRIQALQLQHGREMAGRTDLTYGIDIRRSDPRTEGTIHGRYEENDIMSEFGAYVTSTTPLRQSLDLIAAMRFDYHDRINDLAFSPRAGLVYSPSAGQALRLTWNRAFNSPSATDLFIDFSVMGLMPGMDVRLLGVPRDGFTFDQRCDGEYCMYSVFNPEGRTSPLPATAASLWPILQMSYPELAGVPAPTPGQVGTTLRALDLDSGAFSRQIPGGVVNPVGPDERIITNSIEIGYKGSIGGRAHVALDLYGNRVENMYGEYFIGTPNVFCDEQQLVDYLVDVGGLTPGDAADIASGQFALRMGTIAPDQAGSPDLLMVVGWGGSIEYWGTDVALEVALTDWLTVSGSYSYVDETVFESEEIGKQILSIPRNKGSVGVQYRDLRRGWDAYVKYRGVESYPVATGTVYGDVESYHIADVGIGYRFSWAPQTRLSLTAWNLFDNRHREFPLSPELGRIVAGQMHVTF